ncbi:MAG: transcriptional repressor [Actinomycetota bacterium]|nr:transcriptional repressor [Actinomycetota bacterium]
MTTGGDGRLEKALELLRARGGRVTSARRAVLSALLDHEEHASAEALAEVVHASHPDVHLSTVYRTLDAFEQLGVVTHVHLGHGRAVYHLTDEIHHHAVCDRCGSVVQLPLALFAQLHDRLRDDFGFEVDAHHFALAGRCASCLAESRAEGERRPPAAAAKGDAGDELLLAGDLASEPSP